MPVPSLPGSLTVAKRMAASLGPGDKYMHGDDVVTIIGGQEPAPNQFGLPWFRYLAKTEDGRTGYVVFGQTGTVEEVEN